jgi:hypothetical protein
MDHATKRHIKHIGHKCFGSLLCFCAFLWLGIPLRAQDGAQLEQVFNTGFVYRNLGPFRVSAWVSDIAVPETPEKAHLYTFYVASRNGGVWKTTNNGTTQSSTIEINQPIRPQHRSLPALVQD